MRVRGRGHHRGSVVGLLGVVVPQFRYLEENSCQLEWETRLTVILPVELVLNPQIKSDQNSRPSNFLLGSPIRSSSAFPRPDLRNSLTRLARDDQPRPDLEAESVVPGLPFVVDGYRSSRYRDSLSRS